MWLKNLFTRKDKDNFDPAFVLDRTRYAVIYAIGDVHGCLDLALKIESRIVEEHDEAGGSALILYLGDIIDRGPNSAQVLEHFLSSPLNGFERRLVAGNHELMFNSFMRSPSLNSPWLNYGGRETLESYGVNVERLSAKNAKYLIESAVPEDHRAFLGDLPPYLLWGDYLFAHAGLDTEVRLGEQTADLTALAAPNYQKQFESFGKIVVHGHRIVDEPIVSDVEISLDTGAYATGLLTYAKLTGYGNVDICTISL